MTNTSSPKRYRCNSCKRRYRGHGEWNVTLTSGRTTGLLCPQCQTPEQNAEAAINEATLDYHFDAAGLRCTPKVG